MASALIRIDQPLNPIPIGVPGIARDDIVVGRPVIVNVANKNGVRTRRWVLEPAYGSAVALSSTDGEAPTFTPDVDGTYLIKLSVNAGGEGEVSRLAIIVRDPAGHRFPATTEAAEANYQIAPGQFNTEGWKPDVQRMLQSFDNRGRAPLEVTVAAGDTEQIEVVLPDNMDEAVLQYLLVFAPDSSDSTVLILAGGVQVLELANIDASGAPGYRYLQNVSIINDAAGLTAHTFFIRITNNDAAPADYQVYLRVKAT